MTARLMLAALGLTVFVVGCGETDVILPGVREDVRAAETLAQATPVQIPAARMNADWTQRNGGPARLISHPALTGLTLSFAVGIGAGDSARARITAEPVISDGVIYTLDSATRVAATSVSGAPLWAVDLPVGLDNRSDASGGGLAVSGGRLFVTTGFGEITALDAATGTALWTQDLDAPGTSAPAVQGDLVYVVGRNSIGWAIDTDTGRVRWQTGGTPSVTAFGGGAGPAVAGDLAVMPFNSGEVIGVFPQGGTQRWSTVVAGGRPGAASSIISDIGGDPVIAGGRVYVGNVSGTTAAIDSFSGERIWTATEGAVGPVWPVGGALFLINDLSQLIRLDAATGAVVWRSQLPEFTPSGLFGRSRTVFAHYGPVLAGGQLIVASSDGMLRSFDPQTGAERQSVPLPGGAASAPAVAGGTLYVVSKTGQLLAFR